MSKSSQMPDGGYNPQLGSNYMMDGFDFDSEYGKGPDSTRKIPDPDLPRSSRGLSGLPDGFIGEEPEEEFDFSIVEGGDEHGLGNLSSMFKEAAPLMDLAWLESAEQDPARLPESVNQIEYTLNDLYHQTELEDVPGTGTRPELEQAWGVNRRTDGQNIVPNVEYPRPAPAITSSLPGTDQWRTIVAHAMRKSAFGDDFDSVLRDVIAFFGLNLVKLQASPSFSKLASAVRSIRAEHGLVGNVYVRDSAFPGILSGKWDSAIKRRCASAVYFLTTPGSKLSAYENYLGKKVVTSIPWGEALDHYRPMIEASGKRIASGSPRQALLAAFTQRVSKTREATTFPIHEVPTTSGREAHEALATARASNKNEEINRISLDRAKTVITNLMKSGGLTQDEAKRLLTSGLEPEAMLRSASEYVTATKVANLTPTPEKLYSGPVFKTTVASKRAQDLSPVLPLEVRRLLRWASVQMNEGAAGKDLDYLLAARFSGDLLRKASEPLTQLRRKHEGLAGHLYVNASAYATPAGVEGCEKGALIHRANQLKAVLSMDRCASCVANVENHCQKYSKAIVTAAPVKDTDRYQAEMIRLANADDSERTASFFAPVYDEGDYQLQNDTLDSIEYDNTPPVEELGDILFEGLILDTDEE
jgi:hypothetical protein